MPEEETKFNIEKQEAGRDIYHVGGDIINYHPTSEVSTHNNDLREFLRQWKKSFPVIVFPESIEKCHDDFGSSAIESPFLSIEKRPLFEDINYHLPNGYKDLIEKWNRFKEKIYDYDNKRQNILKSIDDYIDIEMCIKFPAGSIYARAVSLIKKEISLSIVYDYYIRSDGEELRYGIPEANKGFTIGWENVLKIEQIKEKHTDISEKYAHKYNKDIKEIINIEKHLLSKRAELIKMLDELTFFSFPITKCKFMP